MKMNEFGHLVGNIRLCGQHIPCCLLLEGIHGSILWTLKTVNIWMSSAAWVYWHFHLTQKLGHIRYRLMRLSLQDSCQSVLLMVVSEWCYATFRWYTVLFVYSQVFCQGHALVKFAALKHVTFMLMVDIFLETFYVIYLFLYHRSYSILDDGII